MQSSLLLLLHLMASSPSRVESCSAGHNHPHFQRRNPPLFTFSKNLTKTEKLCAIQLRGLYTTIIWVFCKILVPGRDSLSCQAVDVNPEAFLAKSLTVPVTPDSTLTNSILEAGDGEDVEDLQLVKRMQLGLELALHDRNGPATAQVQYSGRTGNVIFVIKAGRVFGSLAEEGMTYNLEPCIEQGKDKTLLKSLQVQVPCHLWVKALKKKQFV